MSNPRTAGELHAWLNAGMRDGSLARDGVLHVRLSDFRPSDRAASYLNLGIADATLWDASQHGQPPGQTSQTGHPGQPGQPLSQTCQPPGQTGQPQMQPRPLLGHPISCQRHHTRAGLVSEWNDLYPSSPATGSPQQFLWAAQRLHVALLALWHALLPLLPPDLIRSDPEVRQAREQLPARAEQLHKVVAWQRRQEEEKRPLEPPPGCRYVGSLLQLAYEGLVWISSAYHPALRLAMVAVAFW